MTGYSFRGLFCVVYLFFWLIVFYRLLVCSFLFVCLLVCSVFFVFFVLCCVVLLFPCVCKVVFLELVPVLGCYGNQLVFSFQNSSFYRQFGQAVGSIC